MNRVQKSSHVEVVVDAPVHQVWAVVSDVTRVGEWSHECRGAEWLGAAAGPAPGARFRGHNRAGWWARWSRQCQIVAVDEPYELVWQTVPTVLIPDTTEWRIRLEPSGGGTRITQSYDVLRATGFHDRLFALLIPAHRDRDERLAEDLRRIGEVARAGTGS